MRFLKRAAMAICCIAAMGSASAEARTFYLNVSNLNNKVVEVDLGDKIYLSGPSEIHCVSRVTEEAYRSCLSADLMAEGAVISNELLIDDWVLNIVENSQDLNNTINFRRNASYFYVVGPNIARGGIRLADAQGACQSGTKFEVRIKGLESETPKTPAAPSLLELQARIRLNSDINHLALVQGPVNRGSISDKPFIGGYQVAAADAEGRLYLKTLDGQPVNFSGYDRWSSDTVRWVETLPNGMKKVHSGYLTYIDPHGTYAFMSTNDGAPIPVAGAGFSIDNY